MELPKQDHPRVCGKNNKALADNLVKTGSPPRVREKLNFGFKKLCECGITPACAGKTNENEAVTLGA